jgi:signal transduction histidine kinase
MSIRDNGRGITEPERDDPSAIGLLGMRERTALMGGIFRITGRRGKGTVVSIEVPVTHKPGEIQGRQKTKVVR